jgi:hypothetical protein
LKSPGHQQPFILLPPTDTLPTNSCCNCFKASLPHFIPSRPALPPVNFPYSSLSTWNSKQSVRSRLPICSILQITSFTFIPPNIERNLHSSLARSQKPSSNPIQAKSIKPPPTAWDSPSLHSMVQPASTVWSDSNASYITIFPSFSIILV